MAGFQNTFFYMSFDSPPLIQPTANADWTHQDHPVMESKWFMSESLLLCDLF